MSKQICLLFGVLVLLLGAAVPAFAQSRDCASLLTALQKISKEEEAQTPQAFRVYQDRFGKKLILLEGNYTAVQRYKKSLQQALGQEVWVSRLNGGRFGGESIVKSIKYLRNTDYMVLTVAGALIGAGAFLGINAVHDWINAGNWSVVMPQFYASTVATELGALLGLAHLAERGNVDDLINDLRDDEQTTVVIIPIKHISARSFAYLAKSLKRRGFQEVSSRLTINDDLAKLQASTAP